MKRATPTTAAPVCVWRGRAIIGESPLWNVEENKLYWIDIQQQRLHRFDPRTRRNETFRLPEVVTSFTFRKNGGLLLTLKKTFAFFDPATGELERFGSVELDEDNNRFNDGKADPAGNYWAGTMNSKEWKTPAGRLYRFGRDHAVQTMLTKLVCSNGCGWSPDGRTFYHTQTFRYIIHAYDWNPRTGGLSRRRVFAEVDPKSGGFPDGLTVDAEGFVWSCQVGLGRIVRYDPAGNIERIVPLPVPRATDCTFGGDDLGTLYITTARETMDAAALRRAPLSGSLFAMRPGVYGLPARRFAG